MGGHIMKVTVGIYTGTGHQGSMQFLQIYHVLQACHDIFGHILN